MLRTALRRLWWRLAPPVLALGGGGARGFAHIGVLQVVDRLGLPVRAMVGTSMGAVIAAMYASHGSAQAVHDAWREALGRKLIPSVPTMRSLPETGLRENPLIQVARKIRDRVVISVAMNRRTMLDDAGLREALEFLIPAVAMEELRPPVVAVATDLETGRQVCIDRGSVHLALRASGAIPGLLPEVEVDGALLVDGAVVAEVPVAAARARGRRVVAVDVSMDLPPMRADRLALDTMMRTQMMTSERLRAQQLARCSAVLRPAVGQVSWAEWSRLDELVEAGRVAAARWLGVAVEEPPRADAGFAHDAEEGADPRAD